MIDLCNSYLKFIYDFFKNEETHVNNYWEIKKFSLIHDNTYENSLVNDTQPTRQNSVNLYDNYISPPKLPKNIIFNEKD